MSKQFKPMRSRAPEAEFPVTYPKLASYKLDGIRVCKFQGETRTKSGKPLPNLHIRKWIEDNVPEGFDMEVISGDPFAPDAYRKTFSAAMTIQGEPAFTLYAFDLCSEFALRMPASARLSLMELTLKECDASVTSRLRLVCHDTVNSQEECDLLYGDALAAGAEGLILKDPNGFYKYGKSTPKQQTQLKLKPDVDEEALITGVYEGLTNMNVAFTNEVGETKRSTHAENKVPNGRLGGFRCIKDGITFDVGPGKFTHAELEALWQQELAKPGVFAGRFLKFRHLGYGLMTNGCPRHPRALGFRAVEDMEPV